MAETPRTRRTDPPSGAGPSGPEAAPDAGPGFEWDGAERFRVPPPHADDARPGPDLSALVGLLGSVRAILPPELDQQFTALVREILLTLRALIDWYLERLDRTNDERRVEDIPIE
jgi:hypothetical protein